MKQNIIETLIGFAVLAVAAGFLIFAYNSNMGNRVDGACYYIKARFQNIEGVNKGSDVEVAGIKVGVVDSISLDSSDFSAIISLKINNEVKLPKDSEAAVNTSGLLGGKYIAIIPGSEEDFLNDGEQIQRTQSAFNLEALIGKLMYSLGNK